jgi:16S rRNA (guanine527-N7)-methyltransferase
MFDFDQLLGEKGINLSPTQKKQLHTYYQLLVEWNNKMNLTAITEEKDVYLKHFFDSLTPGFFYDFSNGNKTLCDVGSGAGFPSIPLKILFPNLQVTIVDALNKRLNFLRTLIKELSLDNVFLFHDRAETFGHKPEGRECFDVVTARAVARLNVLCEYCLPLTKVGGMFIAMKGASGEEEVKEAKKAINVLGGTLDQVEPFLLPEEKSHRHLIFVKKAKNTPKQYPRKPGIPSKEPL